MQCLCFGKASKIGGLACTDQFTLGICKYEVPKIEDVFITREDNIRSYGDIRNQISPDDRCFSGEFDGQYENCESIP